jgi:hypothetical protein
MIIHIVKGHRSFQFRKNWEGKGRAVARVLSPPGPAVHRIKIDEKAGICITTYLLGGLSVIHLFSSTVLWCLPLVREFFHHPTSCVLLDAQMIGCSRMSASMPTASTTMGISSLII